MITIKNNDLCYACQRIGVQISEIRYASLDESWNLKNMRSAFTRIYFPIKGEATLIFGEREIPLRRNNIYIIPSGVTFSSRCDDSLEKIYVHLTVTHPDNPHVFPKGSECIVLEDRENRINEILELYGENTLESVLNFKKMLYEIVSDSLALCAAPPKILNTYSKEIRDILEYIDENVNANLTVNHISRIFFIPPSTLQRRFKAETGRSVGQYVDESLNRVIEQALLDPALTVGEISERLGFCDQFYFSRRFKKTHGVSPRVFRERHSIK